MLFRQGSFLEGVSQIEQKGISVSKKGKPFIIVSSKESSFCKSKLSSSPSKFSHSPSQQSSNSSGSMTEIFSDTGLRQLTQMFMAIIFFHTSEYILALAIHGPSRVTLSSLLITKHYVLAMLVSLLEYLIEITLFPNLKQHWWISNFGLVMILLGEVLRKTAIITAGRSFTHLIKIRHEDHHKLVTQGVYRIVRHPSYSGFLIWSVGTQVMLCNPVSVIAFAVVVWKFFADRIPYEEHYLKQFFGRQYVEYAERVHSGVPFVN